MNEKNASTALDKTADDIQEARDDNACDDAEEEDDEEEEHGEGRAASGVQRKRRQERSFYFTTEAVKRMHSKEGGILTAMCQVGGHVECKKTITMPNGGTQGVLQHFGRCHPALNLKIRALNLTPSAAKNPPNFMTLLNQDVPEAVARQNPIIQSLDRALTRGDKLFTGQPKENLDMMFTKLLIQEDLPLNLGESAHFQDFMLEVSKGSYKGASRQTVRALLSLLSDLGRKEARLFVSRCLQGGTRLTLSGDLWSADGIGLFAIFGHYINQDFQICSGLLGLVSCGAEHHTGDYVKQKLEHTNIERVDCRLTVPHTCQSLPTINQLLISTVY